MSKSLSIIVFSIALALQAGCLPGVRHASAAEDRTGAATSFVQALVDERFLEATATFDAAVLQALPADKLQQTWEGLLAQCGAFKSLGEARAASEGGYETVYVPCTFESAVLDVKLVFNQDGKIGGLWFVPHVPADQAQYTSPAYVHPELFEARDVTVGKGEWQLPGTLLVPRGAGPFPALVLVHGSGPNDRDETVGPNKPFRDLAEGLASLGIAVLRYEKRTKVYGARIAASAEPFTVKEETVDDALAAVELLRHAAGIDPQRIFVLGHSLGGMLIPRIGAADAGLAGLIVMAGPTRPLEDIMLDQVSYLASLGGAASPEVLKQIDAVRAQIATIKSLELKPGTPASQALGAPGSYWLDLRGYNPAEAAKALSQPLLIIQGGRDYQVTLVEFEGWQQALSDRPEVSFKLYPDLNHLFMEGKGMSTPDEYGRRGPIPEMVIADLAGWIKAS